MPKFCTGCGGQLPEGANACPNCGLAVGQAPAAAPPAAASAGGLTDNVAGLLAYLFIPAIIFLVVEPYNKNKFTRFHSFQDLFFVGAQIVIWIALIILSSVLAFIPILGHIAAFLLWLVIGLGFFVTWIVLMIKAFQNQMWKLPIIGDMAEKQANAM
jgi:uncharacterized membrane protein